MKVVIKTRYDYDGLSKDVPVVRFDKADKDAISKTNQSDMPNADINTIMARYEKTGVIVGVDGLERQPTYGDFSEVTDYHSQLSAIKRVETAFNVLPVGVRNRFDNDVSKLMAFLDDSRNDKEAVRLGLKDASVLLTEISSDGKTRLTPEDKLAELRFKEASAAKAADAPASGGGATKS